MIEVQVPKDVSTYESPLIGPLTARQAVCVAAAAAVEYIYYLVISTLERKVLIPMKNDRLNEYREEMNEMLIDKMSKARNNIIHEKYFIATVEADDITSAKNTFSRLDDEIERGFQRVAGEKANAAPLTLVERLSTLYDIYNMDSNVPFYRRTKMKSDKVMESFNMRHIQKMGLTSKDVIGPTALTFERDYMIIGETYARAMMITDLPTGKREIEIRSLNVDMETDENGKVTKINKVTETGRTSLQKSAIAYLSSTSPVKIFSTPSISAKRFRRLTPIIARSWCALRLWSSFSIRSRSS